MDLFGVGPTLGPQLIAEIGDVRRFYSKKALVAYAGLDAPPNDSGDVTGRHKSMSKIGASSLRRTLFLVMSVYLQTAPLDEPVYQFMDRKRAEGKPYRVYMMASANKFLRIYYATVKAYLESLEHTPPDLRHKAIGWPPFHFEMQSGLVRCGTFTSCIALKFLLDFS